jgi:signal transduction histidine kinase
LYDGLKDSIINENTAREIQQLEANYLLAKKDTEIGFLNEQKKLHEEKIKKQQLIQNLSILFASLVVLTTFLLVNRIRLKRKNRLQQELNNRQSEVFSLTAAIQDKERKRIAQDLHDGMGTLLSAARLKLSSLTNTLPEVNDTLVLLDDATAELRNISHNIMPAALSRLGLTAALKNLLEKISESKGIHVNFITHGIQERLPEEKEIFIYRIILELVNNVVKHSGASEATVQLVRYPSEINITVEDNGNGISGPLPGSGLGLSSIQSRVDFLKGSFYIDFTEGAGTIAVINVPC